ncbi:MAG: M48 family metalloprotease [Chthonomonadales bacterium]|nr:M48 family metalloprotease [Chthonomonadales bacterium]
MYEQIARNRRDSALLVTVVTVLLLGLGYVIARAWGMPGWGGLAIAAAVAGFTFLISYYQGDAILLGVSRARQIEKKDNPQLFNVVEEMAIASGLPLPRVFVIDDSAPNAFATGRDPRSASVAVTTGLLSKLNRDELQGVIAHEMSHIRNLDIRLSMLLAVMVGSIALLSDMFVRSTWYGGGSRRRSSRENDGQAVFAILALVLAILAPLFAKMLEMAVSRRREYLADASGALITRYPAGLASALEKISSDREVLEVANRATQHLYIVNPIRSFEQRAAGLFDTHPPINERVQRLRAMALQPASPAGADGTAPESDGAMPVGAVGLVGGPAASESGPAVDGAATCPRCGEELGRGRVEGRDVQGCRQCGGVWLADADFRDLLARAPGRLDAVDRRYPNVIGGGWDSVTARRCPRCGIGLAAYRPDSAPDLSLDRCPRCRGLWFDDGELSAAARSTRG